MAFLDEVYSAVSSVAGFNALYHNSNGDQCLVTSHVKLFDHAPLGKTSRVRITVDNTRECTVHVLLINDFNNFITGKHSAMLLRVL